jgi:hypothetical protein
LTSPLYVAETESIPTGKAELVNRPTLPLRATGPPSGEAGSKTNETEPVAPAVAVAVSVTACPWAAGFGAAVRVRVLGAWQDVMLIAAVGEDVSMKRGIVADAFAPVTVLVGA